MLAGDPGALTLEDVFHAVLVEQAEDDKSDFSLSAPDETQRDIEVFVSQATMHVNDAISKHLRKFSLDRFKPSPSRGSSYLPYET